MTDPTSPHSPQESIAALEARLRQISRGEQPLQWAVAAYRLGLARAEQLGSAPHEALRAALALFDQANEILTRQRAPLEHARVLNAAGSARRLLGDTEAAARLFDEAARLMGSRGVAGEQASVLSNLGVALNELGRPDEAIASFAQSLQVLPRETDEQRRTLVATLHNLAQAQASLGTSEGLEQAIATLDEAVAQVAALDAPLHQGMVWHSLGVSWKAKAAVDPGAADAHIDQAIVWLQRSLTIFTVLAFPFQFAIAKHNLGHALAVRSDIESLRRALLHYEDALNIFDPRLHPQHWSEARVNLHALETRLETIAPGRSRADHIATLLGAVDEIERLAFLRHRFAQLEPLPEQQRIERLTEFAIAALHQPPASFVATLKTTIMVLMELPDPLLRSALIAQIAAHATVEPHDRRAADFMLDEAINLLLFGPQRIRVRDLLQEIGWDRP